MEIKKKPGDIYAEYADGKEYNANIGLYERVDKNWRFYEGDQWHGVKAPNLAKPVFNIIKRVVNYFVAMLVSDDIAVHLVPFDDTEQNKVLTNIIAREIDEVIERSKIKAKMRINIRNCAIDGDTDMYLNFDPDLETGQEYKGDIAAEIMDNVNVIFGNPYNSSVQEQPYILIVQRLYTKQVKEMAEGWKVPKADIDRIVSDDESSLYSAGLQDNQNNKDLTTVITKLWKEKKAVPMVRDGQVVRDPLTREPLTEQVSSVHSIKVTREVVLKKETDMSYKLYPIAHMSWEKSRNSYHGKSPLTHVLPNQIFVNKIYAMAMVYATNNAFPRTVYDNTKISKLTNDISKAIAVPNMDLAGKLMDSLRAPDFSNQVLNLAEQTISYTKDTMGASDAALGNVSNPDNTSAIIAVQQASAVPLEIQRLAYYDFIEDVVRCIIDVMSTDYGTRKVKITEQEAEDLQAFQPVFDQMGQPVVDPATGQPAMQLMTTIDIDFDTLKHMNYNLDVSIGQSTFWNETTQIQTMDNLFSKGIITDPVIYLEGIPDKYVPNKAKIVEKLKEAQRQQEMLAQAQAQMAAMPQTTQM